VPDKEEDVKVSELGVEDFPGKKKNKKGGDRGWDRQRKKTGCLGIRPEKVSPYVHGRGLADGEAAVVGKMGKGVSGRRKDLQEARGEQKTLNVEVSMGKPLRKRGKGAAKEKRLSRKLCRRERGGRFTIMAARLGMLDVSGGRLFLFKGGEETIRFGGGKKSRVNLGKKEEGSCVIYSARNLFSGSSGGVGSISVGSICKGGKEKVPLRLGKKEKKSPKRENLELIRRIRGTIRRREIV